MTSAARLLGLLGATTMILSSTNCVDRVITEEDPLGGFQSEEALCRQYCEVLSVCGFYNRESCLGECIDPHEKWPWLTDECLSLRREMLVCTAGYSCEDYEGRGREGDLCIDEWYEWEAAGYECFGQYTETDGWQGNEE